MTNPLAPRCALAVLALALHVGGSAAAQQDSTRRPRPEDTEVWRPVPVVAPGRTDRDAPADAIVLFDGTSAVQWVSASDKSPARWTVADGMLTVNKAAGDIETKRSFTNFQLHIEWRIPPNVTGAGQLRGNSGVFLAFTPPHGGYELQVVDSYDNQTYANGQAGSIYKQFIPLANAMRKPGDWQTYDVVWTAPTFTADGSLKTPAYVTAMHNGVLIQNHVALRGVTQYIGQPDYQKHGAAPIMLQAHDDPSPPISFRNIWVRELPPSAGNPLRVLVYNIHAGKDAAGKDNLERVAALVRETAADVALLQEVDRNTRRSSGTDQPAMLARLTGFHAAFGKTLDFEGGEYGIAILSRWPISRDTLVKLPVEPPQERSGGSYEPRGALQATIFSPYGSLVVVNTHLDPSRDDGWRRQEIRRILAIVEALRAPSRTLLAGGDLNSTPESAVQDTVRAAGLRDAWLACGKGTGFTYPADSAAKRIDYLYLTDGAECDEARVLATEASDHRPLLVVVRIPARN